MFLFIHFFCSLECKNVYTFFNSIISTYEIIFFLFPDKKLNEIRFETEVNIKRNKPRIVSVQKIKVSQFLTCTRIILSITLNKTAQHNWNTFTYILMDTPNIQSSYTKQHMDVRSEFSCVYVYVDNTLESPNIGL